MGVVIGGQHVLELADLFFNKSLGAAVMKTLVERAALWLVPEKASEAPPAKDVAEVPLHFSPILFRPKHSCGTPGFSSSNAGLPCVCPQHQEHTHVPLG